MPILQSSKYIKVEDVIFRGQNHQSLKKLNFDKHLIGKIALKMIYYTTTSLIFGLRRCFTPWPSGLRRQTFQIIWTKIVVGPGVNNFFFFFSKFKIFDLSSNFVFPRFSKPYVTFLLIFMTIFHEMAPLFSYEPTVHDSFLGI